LGLRPELDGLRIDPCIPAEWPGFSVRRRFRGKMIEIQVKNPDRVCRGVKSLVLNGRLLSDNLLLADTLLENNEVEVILG
jgi:cellobiose phosphorylase